MQFDANISGSILVMRIGRMGDFLVSLPALALLRCRYPTHKIFLLTGISTNSRVAKMAAGYAGGDTLPWVQFCIPELVDETITACMISSLRGWWRLRRQCSQMPRFDAIYVLNYFGEGGRGRLLKRLWLRTLGVRGRIFDSSHLEQRTRPAGVSHQVWTPYQTVAQNPVTSNLQEPNDLLWKLRPRLPAFSWRRRLGLDGVPAADTPLVAMVASATHDHKRWQKESFAELGRRLSKDKGAMIVLVGSSGDRETADMVCVDANAARIVNLCGETDLASLAALFAECDLFVGNDGGSAHLAAAVGLPCVTIMSGVHQPGVWDPAVRGGGAVRLDQLDCIGCGSEFFCPRGDSRCVREITVEQVFEQCCAALQTKHE